LIGTPVALHAGARVVTVGGPVVAAVVKPHVKGTTGAPSADVAGAPMVIVIMVFAGKGFTGVNCAESLAAI
jgi:hypothetical protein